MEKHARKEKSYKREKKTQNGKLRDIRMHTTKTQETKHAQESKRKRKHIQMREGEHLRACKRDEVHEQ